MKFRKTFTIALTGVWSCLRKMLRQLQAAFLMITIFATSCGENSATNDNAVVSSPEITAAETVVTAPVENPSDWVSIYSAVLNGQNELGIDFLNYDVGGESDVTKIRQYRGCGLYDLDSNGMPELFIAIRLWEGEFYHVFTIDNDTAKYIGESKGSMIEKSTGVLFGIAGESGYTPNIAYEYKNNSLVEIPGYVQPIPEDYENVTLGENTLSLYSEDIIYVDISDSLDEAVDNYKVTSEVIAEEIQRNTPNISVESSTKETVNTANSTEAAPIQPINLNPIRVNHYEPYIDPVSSSILDGILTEWSEYEYNTNGSLAKKTDYGGVYYFEYEMDDNGNIIANNSTYGVEGVDYTKDTQMILWEEYEYDSKDNQIKQLVFLPAGSAMPGGSMDEDVLTRWIELQYDENGNKVKTTYCNEEGSILEWMEYSYDANDNIIKETQYNADGSMSWWYEYEYDGNGGKTKKNAYNNDGSVWFNIEYGYNELREQFTETYYNADGTIEALETFAYSIQHDDADRVVKETHYRTDGDVDYWLEYKY